MHCAMFAPLPNSGYYCSFYLQIQLPIRSSKNLQLPIFAHLQLPIFMSWCGDVKNPPHTWKTKIGICGYIADSMLLSCEGFINFLIGIPFFGSINCSVHTVRNYEATAFHVLHTSILSPYCVQPSATSDVEKLKFVKLAFDGVTHRAMPLGACCFYTVRGLANP